MAKRFEIPAVPKGEVAKYIDNPYGSNALYFGGYKKNSDGILIRPDDDFLVGRGGAEAFNVYQRLLFDDTVSSAMSKLTQEITVREWKLESHSELPGDVAIKEFVEDQLNDLQMDELYKSLVESYIVGFSVFEVMWARTPGGIVAKDVRFRDQRRFRFESLEDADLGFTMKLMTREDAIEGIELPPRKFVPFRYWIQSNGDPYGCGLGRILYPLVKFKRRALESQLLYSDRFANPTAVAKAPLSATVAEIDTLYDHLSNLSQETALVMPEGYELEFVNPGGTPETFEKLRDSLIRDITMLIAGEEESGSAGAGSKASSEVAAGVRVNRAQDISELISRKLNKTLIRWIVDLNFGTNVKAPRIYRDFEAKEDVSLSMSDVATLVKDVGLRPTVEWVADRFNVELEEEQFEIPQGPEGTSGVDTLPGENEETSSLLEQTTDEITDDGSSPLGQLSSDLTGDEEIPDPVEEEVAVPEEGEEPSQDTSGDEAKKLRNVIKGLLG